MEPVPFKIKNVHGGLSEASGRIRVDDLDLLLEVENRFLYAFSTGLRAFRLDVTDLDEVRHKRPLFGDDMLELTVRDPLALAGVPGAKAGTLRLHVARADRPRLDVLLDALRLWIR